jgi:hypothetical protein
MSMKLSQFLHGGAETFRNFHGANMYANYRKLMPEIQSFLAQHLGTQQIWHTNLALGLRLVESPRGAPGASGDNG